eukprot:scaffold16852_cov65-Skeletonema_dohrnii-CCMP3373.AAC.3
MMNIDETFAPRPHLFFVGAKLVLAVWLLVTMVISILENEPYYGFWFAYLSSWCGSVGISSTSGTEKNRADWENWDAPQDHVHTLCCDFSCCACRYRAVL